MYLPSGENSSTRLFPVSVTQMLPFANAMPHGALSWPGSEPAIPALQLLVQVSSSGLPSLTPQPNVITKVPVGESSSTRLFAESVTHRSPNKSTAPPVGPLNCP